MEALGSPHTIRKVKFLSKNSILSFDKTLQFSQKIEKIKVFNN